MDGPFAFAEAGDDEYLDFLQLKRREMIGVVLGSISAGAVLGSLVAVACGQPAAAVDVVQAMGVLLVVTAVGLGAFGFTQGGLRRGL